jgi:hypothetical protein
MPSSVALVCLVLAGRVAASGPWCGGGEPGWAPASRHVPRHAHLVFYLNRQRYGGGALPEAVERVRATIDGKPVKTSVSHVIGDVYALTYITIESSRIGALAVSLELRRHDWPHQDSAPNEWRVAARAEFTVDADWSAGEPKVGVSRYQIDHLARENYSGCPKPPIIGATIETDLQAIAFVAKWRRDRDDTWRTLQLPALAQEGHTILRLGDNTCIAPQIPHVFLERGIELELTAQLPDGKQVALPVPKPFVLPPAQP